MHDDWLAELPEIVRLSAIGDLDGVSRLLDTGVPATTRDEFGWTALHAAAVRRHPEVVRLLLATGLDPDIGSDIVSPLVNAAGPGDSESIAALIAAGAAVDGRSDAGESALSRAAGWDNHVVVKLLIDVGALPDEPDQSGYTPLMAAAESGSLRSALELMAAGADPRRRTRPDGDDVSENSVDLARRFGYSGLARVLAARVQALDLEA